MIPEQVDIFSFRACWFNMSQHAGINTSKVGLTVNRYLTAGKVRNLHFCFRIASMPTQESLVCENLETPGNVLAISKTCRHACAPAACFGNSCGVKSPLVPLSAIPKTRPYSETIDPICKQMQKLWLLVHAITVIVHQCMQKWSEEAHYPVVAGSSCSSSLRWNNCEANLLAIYVGFSRIAVPAQKIEPFAADLCQT